MPSIAPSLARATAPGGVGNLGPGLDVLGCALTGARDEVILSWATEGAPPGISIADPGHPDLPVDPARHASAIAAQAVIDRAGHRDAALVLRARKGLPLAGGQGGSAASAVAGAVAADALLGTTMDPVALLECALVAESAVAGRHADNLASALLGGVILVRAMDPLDIVSLAYPAELRVALLQPAQRLRTADARAVLPATLDRAAAMRQAAQVAGVVAALSMGDWDLLRRALDDPLAEPVRAPLIEGFRAAKDAALDAGAFGCSISGAGPSIFAIARGDAHAHDVAEAMRRAYAAVALPCTTRVAAIDDRGAHVECSVATAERAYAAESR